METPPETKQVELGLDTFGDVTRTEDGKPLPHSQVIREVVEEAILADELGVDFIGLGEHHRADFAISSPEMVLATIAGQTKRIRLGSAVTVLSSDDPIRVFQRFSTLNAVSNGRAEVILGRGSFTESFPLFGFPLEQYEVLFEEKLSLYAAVLESDRTGEPITWRGSIRPPINGLRAYPGTDRGKLTTWIGVGGSPESVVRAARYKIPMMLAIIGGDPRRFVSYINLYKQALNKLGTPTRPIGVHSPGYIAETDAQAREDLWPAYRDMRNKIGAERGWGPTSPAEFDREIEDGSLYVGSPETVAQKIAATIRDLGVQRFDMKYSAGWLAHEKMMRCITFYAREVMPRVRELLSSPGSAGP